MTVYQALGFVRRHGIVLMSARGPAPSLAERIVGGAIRGSWWAHPRSHEIYRLMTAVSESREVLVCRLVDGRVTLIHRRLWPAVARLARRFPKSRLAAVRQEHTPRGHHRTVTVPFARRIPAAVLKQGEQLTIEAATEAIGADLLRHLTKKK